ncbi:hypothetical protein Mgra_00002308 [Meloidogyne graminicola]|uniref:Uncharacterized protein n=1 Tax=Meloidogyne graminicola TaxID=189291 RepID=A0A8S9ZYF8_9BILA|nr:hypothetical protein Mgra_00002308 [Meloidogyne graminicola]
MMILFIFDAYFSPVYQAKKLKLGLGLPSSIVSSVFICSNLPLATFCLPKTSLGPINKLAHPFKQSSTLYLRPFVISSQ